ncbi:MAG TPA: LysR family transcriptional regulator [Cytophagales bacterium]|nr:LysR family transcriptional regulator [Cytophagales bacterium]HAP61892.1 LysR family transcriptional regulator [Cytophagales bacterium]
MDYTIHQLRVFLKVAHLQSVTRASEELNMTQPAVSIQLKNFQDQFDIPLTEVIGRKLYVTDFGREIEAMAGSIMENFEAIRYKTEAYRGMLTGKLKISSASTGKYVMPYFLTGFLAQHSGVDLVLDVTNKSQVVASLKRNEIDFALVSVLPDNVEVEEELMIDNKLYLVSREPERNEDHPLIYREEGSATRAAMEAHFGPMGKLNRRRIELTSNEAVKQAVMAGLGDSIMPLIGIRNELLKEQLYLVSAPDLPIITRWRLVWLKGKKFSPVAAAYLDYLKEAKHRILEEEFDWFVSE